MKLFHLLVALAAAVAFAVPVSAMIITLPLHDLTRQSDVVVIAQVEKVETVTIGTDKIATVRNSLKAETVLKGDLKVAPPLQVFTQQRGKYGEDGALEDQVEFPPVGKRVLVFLKKTRDGKLDLVNGLQGLWPMDGQEFLGFGTGVKLDQVKDAIAGKIEKK